MVIRECPKCCSAWYSADQSSTWVCPKCGLNIPPSEDFKKQVAAPALDISTMTNISKTIH